MRSDIYTCWRDSDGYDADGYSMLGWSREGVHRDTGTDRDPRGYDIQGFDPEGFDYYGNVRGSGLTGDGSRILQSVALADAPTTRTALGRTTSWAREDIADTWVVMLTNGYITKRGRGWVISDAGLAILAKRREFDRY